MALFAVWVGCSYGLMAMGYYFDHWLNETSSSKFSEMIKTHFRQDPANWFRVVADGFSTFFDWAYGWRRTEVNRIIWRAILFAYTILVLARLVLWAFRIPVPATEKILVTALVTSIAGALLMESFELALKVYQNHLNHDRPSLRELVRERHFVKGVVTGFLGVALSATAIIMAAHGVGVSLKTVVAISIGSGLSIPTVILVSRVPDGAIAVGPLRAIVE